jgi:DNA-binding NarL/FixJ family response regulator
LSESALLKRLVVAALVLTDSSKPDDSGVVQPVAATGKISVRLRSDDLLLLRERAQARQIPTATYVSYLIRSHLRRLAPLPTQELTALKRSIAEVGAIGRNINQIAHALNRGEQSAGPNGADLRAVLRALTALRDHVKALIRINLESWEAGHAKTND